MNIRHWLKMAWVKLLRLLGLRPWPRKVSDSDTSGEQKPPAPPVEPDPPKPTLPRLTIRGTRFYAGSQPFRPVGVSQFKLLKRLADGDEAGVCATLDTLAALGFNVVRVFTTVVHMFDLPPDVGRQHLPRLLTLCEARGIYGLIVGLADTAARKFDHQQHLRLLGRICAEHPNTLLTVANEPTHPTQAPIVADPQYLAALKALVPAGVLVSLGAAHGADDESDRYVALSDFGEVHVDRADGDGGWRHVRHAKEAADISRRLNKPILDAEPKRETDPVKWRCKGMLARVLNLPGVFHFDAGRDGQAPTGNALACAQAWLAGLDALPESLEDKAVFVNAGWAGSPVKDADFDKVVRIYSALVGGRCYSVLVGLTGHPDVTLAAGWRVDWKLEYGGCALWRLTK